MTINSLEVFLSEQELQKEIYNISDKDVSNIISCLPDKRYYEYAYHKFFSKNDTLKFNKWNDWKEWSYSIQDLIRFKNIILDNEEFIREKTVIDFGCHLGYLTLFCLHLGSKFVKATNIRKKYLDIAEEILIAAGYNNTNFELLNTDIHNYQTNINLCKDIDTVLLSGIIYHIHDHYNVLESVTKNKPKIVIIEIKETKNTLNTNYPMIDWKVEDAANPVNGSNSNYDTVLVGFPNSKWLDLAMEQLNYMKINESLFEMVLRKYMRSSHVYKLIE